MHNVSHKCIIEFLAKEGFEPIHIDNWAISDVTYYFSEFNRVILRLTSNCVPYGVAKGLLANFNLDHQIGQILTDKCNCI